MNITGICQYETPCGWCIKWDKKCDRKIGCETPHDKSNQNDLILEDIKSGIELTSFNITNHNLGNQKGKLS